MGKIVCEIQGDKLYIKNPRERKTGTDTEEIEISHILPQQVYRSIVSATRKADWDTCLFLEKMQESEDYIMVYSSKEKIQYVRNTKEEVLKLLIRFKHITLSVKMTRQKLKIVMLAYFVNSREELKVSDTAIGIGENICKACPIKINTMQMPTLKLLSPKYLIKATFSVKEIMDDPELSNMIRVQLNVEGTTVHFAVVKKRLGEGASRAFYAPINRVIVKDMMLFLRRNAKGGLTIVKRFLDEYEKTKTYRFWESKFLSAVLYHLGKLAGKISDKPVNLFFEKESAKTEEGAYEVFSLAQKCDTSKNYFIIDGTSEDFEKIKTNPNVIRKYSPKYYWVLYRAGAIISTEAAAHLNILRSSNHYLRTKMIEYKFIFLQHGVTYMKCHGPTSAFVRGREAEPNYIFAGSQKERDVIVDMLRLPEENVIITGLPIFSTIEYGHIGQESDDFVTIMLTFKPYEERLDSFENSEYYRAVIDLYNIVKGYIQEEKILVVAHPRIHYLLEKTDMRDRMWNKPISQVLKITKLLVTDYSSVAYNSFYQGAGVVFYQQDIKEYEEICGKLIPSEEEYIGYRAFDLKEFDQIIKKIIIDGKINLQAARTQQHQKNYKGINAYSDGKNVERIFEELKKRKLI